MVHKNNFRYSWYELITLAVFSGVGPELQFLSG